MYDGFRVTDKRYIAVVAILYGAALSATVLVFGGLNVSSLKFLLTRCWIFLPGAVAIAVLGTLVPIWRFGNAGGSRYFTPTLIHAMTLLMLIFAVVKVLTE